MTFDFMKNFEYVPMTVIFLYIITDIKENNKHLFFFMYSITIRILAGFIFFAFIYFFNRSKEESLLISSLLWIFFIYSKHHHFDKHIV